MEKYIKEAYEYFLQRTMSQPNLDVSKIKIDKRYIDYFIKHAPENATREWVFDFMLFQFSRYYKTKIYTKNDGFIPFRAVTGKKAFEIWNNKTEEQLYYVTKFKLSLGLQKEVDYKKKATNEYKDEIRKRFFNTERGLLFCKEHLLEREKGNKYCLKCKFKSICNGIQLGDMQ